MCGLHVQTCGCMHVHVPHLTYDCGLSVGAQPQPIHHACSQGHNIFQCTAHLCTHLHAWGQEAWGGKTLGSRKYIGQGCGTRSVGASAVSPLSWSRERAMGMNGLDCATASMNVVHAWDKHAACSMNDRQLLFLQYEVDSIDGWIHGACSMEHQVPSSSPKQADTPRQLLLQLQQQAPGLRLLPGPAAG